MAHATTTTPRLRWIGLALFLANEIRGLCVVAAVLPLLHAKGVF
jgi:hypothetical protein